VFNQVIAYVMTKLSVSLCVFVRRFQKAKLQINSVCSPEKFYLRHSDPTDTRLASPPAPAHFYGHHTRRKNPSVAPAAEVLVFGIDIVLAWR
jgi:hypothetical protein